MPSSAKELIVSSSPIPVDFTDPHYGRISTSVLMNPGPRRIVRFLQNWAVRQLRGTACNGILLVYPAWDVTHIQIRRAFALPDIANAGTDFWIIPEDEEPLSSDWEASDDDLVRDGLRLIIGRRGDDPEIGSLIDWFSCEPVRDLGPCPG